MAEGIQFDFSASGTWWYRLTVLNSELGNDRGSVLQPVAIDSLVREIRTDGSTVAWGGNLGFHIAAFHSRRQSRGCG